MAVVLCRAMPKPLLPFLPGVLILFISFIFIISTDHAVGETPLDLLLVTVATERTDGFKRLERSARVNSVELKVLGLGSKWTGGDMQGPGGGLKVTLLREELERHRLDKHRVILFTDAYDVVLLGGAERILRQFREMDAKIVFSAEGFCWPDETLAASYPAVARGKRFLNSGAFIGYAPELYELVSTQKIEDQDDDQLFYTKLYLDADLRNRLRMKLDHRSLIFQNLNGALVDVELRLEADESYLKNTAYATTPLVVHGNGPTKTVLNSLGNYLARSWTLEGGCLSCDEGTLSLRDKPDADLPFVVIAVFIHQPTPFLEDFLDKIFSLEYPKHRLALFIYNSVKFHSKLVDDFVEGHGSAYRFLKTVGAEDQVEAVSARELAMDYCVQKQCSAFLSVDAEAHLDNPQALRLLLEQNVNAVAPLLTRPFKAWSNFWGALNVNGFYARSNDYMDIVNNERRGVWNVPYISSCYLLNASLLQQPRALYKHEQLDPDMAFCHNLRTRGVFMFVSNLHNFGHLVSSENFDVSRKHPDFYELMENRWDWEQRYIHADYAASLDPQTVVAQPCPDVYWFPLGSERFVKEMIDIMENFGKWSDGSNKDERLSGGYENVPTRDIHMNQVGLEPQWLEFLRLYVRPLVDKVFLGYSSDPPRSLMNFVVRYRPDEQPSLRPHHDSSTYTINIALNRPGIDYRGGGCRFLRYNCSVTDMRVGWMLMHPGRLTHFHEGLPVTDGTRYIMISFVDP